MNSKIFDSIGLGNLDPAFIFIALLLCCVALVIFLISTMKRCKVLEEKLDKLMMGKDAATLEEVILERFKEIDSLKSDNSKITEQITEIFENLTYTVQKCGIVKYDAFHEMGGKLSFALVMLNKKNTGHVINAMHSREGCYIYIKEIIEGESYIPLGDEEKQALEKALENH